MGILEKYAQTIIDGPTGRTVYCVVEIFNPTTLSIPYLFRWGTQGRWQSCRLEPGIRMAHSWQDERSPVPHIRFVSNLVGCVVRERQYALRAALSFQAGVGRGKLYQFGTYHRRTLLDLTAVA